MPRRTWPNRFKQNRGLRVSVTTEHIPDAGMEHYIASVAQLAGGTPGQGIVQSPLTQVKSTALADSLVAWNVRYNSVRAYVQGRGTALLRLLTSAYFTEVTARTPYDTGNAMRHWHVADSVTGAAIQGYTDLRDEPISQDAAYQEAMSNADGVIKGLKRNSRPRIVNRTPYITELETGSSNQAPVGMRIYAEHAVQKVWQTFHTTKGIPASYVQSQGLLKKAIETRELGSKARSK